MPSLSKCKVNSESVMRYTLSRFAVLRVARFRIYGGISRKCKNEGERHFHGALRRITPSLLPREGCPGGFHAFGVRFEAYAQFLRLDAETFRTGNPREGVAGCTKYRDHCWFAGASCEYCELGTFIAFLVCGIHRFLLWNSVTIRMLSNK